MAGAGRILVRMEDHRWVGGTYCLSSLFPPLGWGGLGRGGQPSPTDPPRFILFAYPEDGKEAGRKIDGRKMTEAGEILKRSEDHRLVGGTYRFACWPWKLPARIMLVT